MSADVEVLVAVVAYGSSLTTDAMMDSLMSSILNAPDRIAPTVAYVQNDPAVDSVPVFISSGRPRVVTLHSGRNLGYLGGACATLEVTSKLPNWLVVSNADVLFPPNFFGLFADDCNGEGVRAPQVWDTDTQSQSQSELPENPHLQDPVTVFRLVRSVAISVTAVGHFAVSVMRQRRRVRANRTGARPDSEGACDLDRDRESQRRHCYAVHGSCFAVSNELLRKTDNLKGAPFLFGEEIYIAEQCLRTQLRVSYDPTVVVEHQSHAATGRGIRSRRIVKYQLHAAVKLLRMVGKDRALRVIRG